MSKRPAEEGNSSSGGQTKKVSTTYLPHTIGPVSNSTELDINVLKFQNKKLANRIEQRKRTENELRARIDQLESRQTQDDAVLNAVNRYWNQFNEDIRILLQRFDAETADEQESKNESEVTTSFLAQLSTWDKAELDENLANRVQISKRAVGKIIQVFDRLMQRNDKILQFMKGEDKESNVDQALREQIDEIIKENRNLHEKNMDLHSKNQTVMLNEAKILESLAAHETAEAELKHKIDGLEYELEKVRCRNDKLENHLAEAIEKIKNVTVCQGNDTKSSSERPGGASMTTVASLHLEELKKELDEFKELAGNRLQEIEKLNDEKAQYVNEIDKLKMDMRHLPESVIVETTEYKILQSQFSVLYNESMQINTLLEEARTQLAKSKTEYQRYIEYLESNELDEQKKLRNELLQKQYVLDQTRKEFENLRNKYEQNLAANEQTAPINIEMRQLITSLQNRNGQFKKEIQRYKKKYKDISAENAKLRKEVEEMTSKLNASTSIKPEKDVKNESVTEDEPVDVKNIKEEATTEKVKTEPEENDSEVDDKSSLTPNEKNPVEVIKKEETPSCISKLERENRDLKTQLKKALNDLKDTKVVMDTYKGVGKEQRDKVQLMAAEKKARQELEDVKMQLKKLQESKREDRKDRRADEDILRKLKQLEEKNCELQKQLATQKVVDGQWSGYRPFVGSNEEEALLNEIELTGQAYDDMQEQNERILQQLSSKDDANFKLITERINANQKQALLSAQINELEKQIQYQEHQMETLITLKRKLEEKEKILLNTISNLEKEVDLKQKAMETYKRKATESAQSAQELKMHLEKYVTMLVETQQMMDQKATRFMQESNKSKNLQEELNVYKRKIDRMKNMEMEMSGATIDEVILQENREYKEALTCDSCKVKQKDAVLTKCFHVFCYECLRSRYDSRQRKCPKCNAAFGANDFHRLYLT